MCQEWRSGESARLPPMWPGFKSRCGLRLLLVLSLALSGFSLGTPVFPLLENQHFQIPIRPGIRYVKNHIVDVLPPNHYLFCVLILFTYFMCLYRVSTVHPTFSVQKPTTGSQLNSVVLKLLSLNILAWTTRKKVTLELFSRN